MADTVRFSLPSETTHAADTEYRLAAGETYSFNLNGDGVWEYWDGNAFVAFTEGSGKNFTADIPESGRINLNWTSGTVYAGFIHK